jgi:AraC-like DNA-binding protein
MVIVCMNNDAIKTASKPYKLQQIHCKISTVVAEVAERTSTQIRALLSVHLQNKDSEPVVWRLAWVLHMSTALLSTLIAHSSQLNLCEYSCQVEGQCPQAEHLACQC